MVLIILLPSVSPLFHCLFPFAESECVSFCLSPMFMPKPLRGKAPVSLVALIVCAFAFIAVLYAERISYFSSGSSIFKIKACARKNGANRKPVSGMIMHCMGVPVSILMIFCWWQRTETWASLPWMLPRMIGFCSTQKSALWWKGNGCSMNRLNRRTQTRHARIWTDRFHVSRMGRWIWTTSIGNGSLTTACCRG